MAGALSFNRNRIAPTDPNAYLRFGEMPFNFYDDANGFTQAPTPAPTPGDGPGAVVREPEIRDTLWRGGNGSYSGERTSGGGRGGKDGIDFIPGYAGEEPEQNGSPDYYKSQTNGGGEELNPDYNGPTWINTANPNRDHLGREIPGYASSDVPHWLKALGVGAALYGSGGLPMLGLMPSIYGGKNPFVKTSTPTTTWDSWNSGFGPGAVAPGPFRELPPGTPLPATGQAIIDRRRTSQGIMEPVFGGAQPQPAGGDSPIEREMLPPLSRDFVNLENMVPNTRREMFGMEDLTLGDYEAPAAPQVDPSRLSLSPEFARSLDVQPQQPMTNFGTPALSLGFDRDASLARALNGTNAVAEQTNREVADAEAMWADDWRNTVGLENIGDYEAEDYLDANTGEESTWWRNQGEDENSNADDVWFRRRGGYINK